MRPGGQDFPQPSIPWAERLIEYGLLALFVLVPLPFGSVETWAITLLELFVLGLTVLWLVKSLVRGELSFVRTPLSLPLLLFSGLIVVQLLLYVSISQFSSPDRLLRTSFPGTLFYHGTRSAFLLYLTYAAVFFLLVETLRDRRRLDRFVLVNVLWGGILAFYGLIEHLSGHHAILGWQNIYNRGRLFGTFVNPDHFAAYLEMLLPLALGYLLAGSFRRLRHRGSSGRRSREDPAKGILIGLSAVVMGVALLFTLSRAGIVSFLLAILFLLGCLGVLEAASQKRLVLTAVLTAILGYVAWIGIEPLLARFEAERGVADLASRLTAYKGGLQIVKEFPWLGTGLGTFERVFRKYQPRELDYQGLWSHLHNDLLQLLIEAGLIGFLIFGLAFFSFYKDALFCHLLGRGTCPSGGVVQKRNDAYNLSLLLGALTGTVAIFFHSFLDFSLRIPANAVVLSGLLAVALQAAHLRFQGGEGELLVPGRALPLSPPARGVLGLVMVLFGLGASLLIVRAYWAETKYLHAVELVAKSGRNPTTLPGLGKAEADQREQIFTLLKTAVTLDGTMATYHAALADIYEQQGLRAWTLGISPEDRLLQELSARWGESRKWLEEAKAEYLAALRLDPFNADYHERLAWLYSNLALLNSQDGGQTGSSADLLQRALAQFQTARTLDPNSPEGHRAIGLFALQLPSRMPEVGQGPAAPLRGEELQAFQQAVELDPSLLPGVLARLLHFTQDFDTLAKAVPPHPEDFVHLARLLERQGLKTQAKAALKQAIDLAPNWAKSLYYWLLARYLSRKGEWHEAVAVLDLALRFDPRNPDLQLQKAEALSALGKEEEALEAYQVAFNLAAGEPAPPPRADAASAKGSRRPLPSARERLIQDLLNEELKEEAAYPAKALRVMAAMAAFHHARGRYTEAIALWEKITAEDPLNPAARFGLGKSYDAVGAWVSAQEQYKKALELNPRQVSYRAWVAKRYYEHSMFYQAINQWQEIARLEPTNVEPRLLIAATYARLGAHREALLEYERVLQIQPGHAEARRALAQLRGRLGG